MNHLRKPHLCALGYGCMVTVEGGILGCSEHEAMLSAEEAVAMALAWTAPDAVLEKTATMVVRRLLEATRPPADPCEEAYYHPGARPAWERLLRTIARRKLNIHAADAAVIALTLADAGRDELAGERGCIFIRNGRECPGSDPASHSRHCDIPW